MLNADLHFMAALKIHWMTSATTVTKPSVHKARLTWQWQHLAHLAFDPDQGPLKRSENILGSFIPSSLSLTTAGVFLQVKYFLNSATKPR